MRKAAGSEIAIQNNGGFRTTIPNGKITLEQVYMLLPFDNNLMTMDLTGHRSPTSWNITRKRRACSRSRG